MTTTPLRVEVRSYQPLRTEDTHVHDHHQIVLPLTGGMPLHVGGRADTVRDGRGVFLAPQVPHRFRVEGQGNRFLVVDFTAHAAGIPHRLLPRLAAGTFFSLAEPARHLVRYLADLGGAPDAATAHHALALLLLEAKPAEPEASTRPPTPASARVATATAFLDAHLDQPVTVAEVARAAGLSPSHLQAEFRRQIGCGVAEYLRRARLDRAAALLVDGTRPIVDIALACGYADQTALTRALRKERGVTPGALRRRGGGS